jgi:hypothetical protein
VQKLACRFGVRTSDRGAIVAEGKGGSHPPFRPSSSPLWLSGMVPGTCIAMSEVEAAAIDAGAAAGNDQERKTNMKTLIAALAIR